MYLEQSIAHYLKECKAEIPAPGGGSVAALAGALGASMGAMAANFTTGREKFQAVENEAAKLLAESEKIMDACAGIIDEDIEAYNGFGAASKMPKDTDEQKSERTKTMQAALKRAMEVPMKMVRLCAAQLAVTDKLVDIANPNLVSDVGVSALMAEAGMQGARLNVVINLAYLKDAELVAQTRAKLARILDQAVGIRERVLEKVLAKIG